MKIPILSGLIRRRILVNYRVEPKTLQRILPQPFQPKLINGMGIAGICLIRLEHIHPRWIPIQQGFDSENAAHRIAVIWYENGELREGVYIPRRDTSSQLNVAAGGRVFPGVHHHSHFEIREDDRILCLQMKNEQDDTRVELEAEYSSEFERDSVFQSISDASIFFEGGSIGYSVTLEPNKLDAIELRTFDWRLRPLRVRHLVSSFYENHSMFPVDAISFDCALMMQNLAHEWHAHQPFSIEPVNG